MIYLGNSPVGVVTKTDPNAWVKPDDWPDIESLSTSQDDLVVLYMLYDCETEVRYAGFVLGGSGTKSLSIATYINGVLSEFDSSQTFNSGVNYYCLLPTNCKYAVVKVVCQAQLSFATNSTYKLHYSVNNNGSNQPCLWMYGKIYSDYDMYQNGSAGISALTCERVRLYLSEDSTLGYGLGYGNYKSVVINDGDFEGTHKLYTSTGFGFSGLIDFVGKNIYTTASKLPGCGNICSFNLDGFKTSSGSISGQQFCQDNKCLTTCSMRTNGLKITTLYYAFSGCYNVKKIDLTGCDFSECTNYSTFLSNCRILEDCVLGDGINLSLNLSTCFSLSHDSLVYGIIDKLATVDTPQTLTLSAISKSKLSSSEIAVATEKGWTVA